MTSYLPWIFSLALTTISSSHSSFPLHLLKRHHLTGSNARKREETFFLHFLQVFISLISISENVKERKLRWDLMTSQDNRNAFPSLLSLTAPIIYQRPSLGRLAALQPLNPPGKHHLLGQVMAWSWKRELFLVSNDPSPPWNDVCLFIVCQECNKKAFPVITSDGFHTNIGCMFYTIIPGKCLLLWVSYRFVRLAREKGQWWLWERENRNCTTFSTFTSTIIIMGEKERKK